MNDRARSQEDRPHYRAAAGRLETHSERPRNAGPKLPVGENLAMIGCSHHDAPIVVRERLAFTPEETEAALDRWQEKFGDIEAAIVSTCNRIELYVASEEGRLPHACQLIDFLCRARDVPLAEVRGHVKSRAGRDAAEHLFSVASSLDSMVVGEPQILCQVKEAYQLATVRETAGPLLHALFQAALVTAKRIAGETMIQQRRVSIPSVAVGDFATQIFERFEDKNTLVIGAGEMAEETLRYLRDHGIRDISVVNRSFDRAKTLAEAWQGRASRWEDLDRALAAADLVISTTGAGRPIVTAERFRSVEARRAHRPLFVLDLAMPRDFEPAIGGYANVYLYSIDDLERACEANRRKRDHEMPKARRIVQHETERFLGSLRHRATSPIIRQLREGWKKPKEDELRRLFNRLPELDERTREEIGRAFDRLINKLLHPPLESLRDESRHGVPYGLLEALARLFRLKD